jgi:hypothetical protein
VRPSLQGERGVNGRDDDHLHAWLLPKPLAGRGRCRGLEQLAKRRPSSLTVTIYLVRPPVCANLARMGDPLGRVSGPAQTYAVRPSSSGTGERPASVQCEFDSHLSRRWRRPPDEEFACG